MPRKPSTVLGIAHLRFAKRRKYALAIAFEKITKREQFVLNRHVFFACDDYLIIFLLSGLLLFIVCHIQYVSSYEWVLDHSNWRINFK